MSSKSSNRFLTSLVLAVVASTVILPSVFGESLSSWSFTANYPTKIYEPSCVAYSGFLYCIGGSASPGVATNAVYFASLSSSGVGSWSSTTNYPTNVYRESCVAYSGFVYCIGGSTGSPGVATSAVYFASLSSSGVGSWSSTTNYPTSIYYDSCVPDSGFVYCIGGITSSGVANAVYFASLSSSGVGSWSSTTNYPTQIYDPSCVAYSGFVYCIAGVVSGVNTNAVYFASLSSSGVGSWSSTTNYPTSIYDTSCVADLGFVYCIGGATGNPGVTNAVYFASLSSSGVGSWSSTTNYPTGIGGEGCVAFSGFIYCIGGGTGLAATNAVYYTSNFDFSMSNSGSVTVVQGGSGSNTITATLLSGVSQSVSLSCAGLPAGASCNFNPTSGLPTFPSTLTITTLSSTPYGSFTVTVTGTGEGVTGPGGEVTRTTQFTLTVNPGPFDFSLSSSNNITIANPGESGLTTIFVTYVSGISQPVGLSCSGGLPSGASCSFSPSSGLPTYSSSLTISTSPSTPLGKYTIAVNGTGGGVTRITHINMISVSVVGGTALPIDKLALLAPFIGLVILIVAVATVTAVLVRPTKDREERK